MSDTPEPQTFDELDSLMSTEKAARPNRAVKAVITRTGSWYLLIWEGSAAIVKQVGAKEQKLDEPIVYGGERVFINQATKRVTLLGENDTFILQTSPIVEERDFDKWDSHFVTRIIHRAA